jgi:hypothetical protein
VSGTESTHVYIESEALVNPIMDALQSLLENVTGNDIEIDDVTIAPLYSHWFPIFLNTKKKIIDP